MLTEIRSVVEASGPEMETDSVSGGVQIAFERCRTLGMRLSRQRRMVLDLLWTEKSHLSARDIFE